MKLYRIHQNNRIFSLMLLMLLSSCNQSNQTPLADMLIDNHVMPDGWISDAKLSGYNTPRILDDFPGAIDFAAISYHYQLENGMRSPAISHVMWKYSNSFTASRKFKSDSDLPDTAIKLTDYGISMPNTVADKLLVFCVKGNNLQENIKCTSYALYGNIISVLTVPIEGEKIQMIDFVRIIEGMDGSISNLES